MKYIQNTGRYDRAYEIEKGNQKVMITLYRRRLFMDTGNVAATGITPVEDGDYALLEKNRAFARDFKDADFGLVLIDESVALGNTDKRTAELEEENKKLRDAKKALEKVVKQSKDAKAMKDLADENADLKARLEALTNKGKAPTVDPEEDPNKADEKDEDEGF